MLTRPARYRAHVNLWNELQTRLTQPLTTEPRSGSDRVVHATLNFIVKLIFGC